MPSILFLSLMNGAPWGGSEELWYRLALWMVKNNYRVGVCCYDWKQKKEKLDMLRQAGVTVYLLSNQKGIFKKWQLNKSLHAVPFSNYEYTVINQGGWEEVLHAPFKHLYKQLGRYCMLNHNYNSNASLSSYKIKLLESWMNGATMNFAATEKIFSVIEKNFGLPVPNKATLINPITFLPPQKPTVYPEVNDNEPAIFLMLAELDVQRKAQDILLKVLVTEKWKARNWQLHLYGRGKDEEMLRNLIAAYGLQEKVFLRGFTDNVQQTIAGCHLLLQCTYIDAMPISVVEALAMARPCMVSNVGDMPVWIKDGFNGIVCNNISTESLEETLETCWNHRHKWPEMAENAFQVFSQKYPIPYEPETSSLIMNALS